MSATPAEDALARLAQTLAETPDVPQHWHDLGVALARAGRHGELRALTDRAAPRFGGGLRFFQNICIALMNVGDWACLAAQPDHWPVERPEHAVAVYYAGCERLAAGDHRAALEGFERFKHVVLPRRNEFPLTTDHNFNLIFRQGFLVETPEATRLLLAAPPPATPEPVFVDTPDGGAASFVALCCLDARYFQRFAAELCAGHEALGADAPLHFHVVAADPDCDALFATLRARHGGLRLGYSHEPPGPWPHPVYYTCVRFLVANRMMERYGRPLLTLDADIVPLRRLGDFVAAAGAADFAGFETGRTEPASAYQASIMYFARTPNAARLADDLGRFVLAKMGLPPVLGWMLDQAALYSLLVARSLDDAGFRFCALNRAMKARYDDLVRVLSTAEEKSSIMNRRN